MICLKNWELSFFALSLRSFLSSCMLVGFLTKLVWNSESFPRYYHGWGHVGRTCVSIYTFYKHEYGSAVFDTFRGWRSGNASLRAAHIWNSSVRYVWLIGKWASNSPQTVRRVQSNVSHFTQIFLDLWYGTPHLHSICVGVLTMFWPNATEDWESGPLAHLPNPSTPIILGLFSNFLSTSIQA